VLNEFKHYATKAYSGVDVQSHIFCTSFIPFKFGRQREEMKGKKERNKEIIGKTP
jgi:hypothetical protein